MTRYFDIVDEKLISNTSNEVLENIFFKLNLSVIYIAKTIGSKKDLETNLELPKLKNITFKKLFILEDLSLINSIKEEVVISAIGGNLKNNSNITNNKKIQLLLDPLSERELCFDEGNCNSAKENKITVGFNINNFRNNKYLSIKQALFVINILKIRKVNLLFYSLAKTIDELVDPKITKCFLLNFNLEKETIDKFLDFDRLCLKKS